MRTPAVPISSISRSPGCFGRELHLQLAAGRSGEALLTRRHSSANYTWSRSIDGVSYQTDLCGINVINPYDVGAYRGVSDFNVPHRFVLNYLWQLPSPKQGSAESACSAAGKPPQSGHWQSGFPLNITSGGDYSFSLPEVANDQAQVVGNPALHQRIGDQKLAQWFTTAPSRRRNRTLSATQGETS